MTEHHKSLAWPSAQLMGARFVSWDEDAGLVEFAYCAPEEFANMRGNVQGGLVAGFLDEVMGAAMYMASGGEHLQLTLNMNLSLLRPVPLGELVARGRVAKAGSRIAFVESELFDPQGNLLARASATSIPAQWPGKT